MKRKTIKYLVAFLGIIVVYYLYRTFKELSDMGNTVITSNDSIPEMYRNILNDKLVKDIRDVNTRIHKYGNPMTVFSYHDNIIIMTKLGPTDSVLSKIVNVNKSGSVNYLFESFFALYEDKFKILYKEYVKYDKINRVDIEIGDGRIKPIYRSDSIVILRFDANELMLRNNESKDGDIYYVSTDSRIRQNTLLGILCIKKEVYVIFLHPQFLESKNMDSTFSDLIANPRLQQLQ